MCRFYGLAYLEDETAVRACPDLGRKAYAFAVCKAHRGDKFVSVRTVTVSKPEW